MDSLILSNTELFGGTEPHEAKAMLECLGAHTKLYEKGSTVYHAGEKIDSMGMVLSGGVNIEINDIWGNTTILEHVEPGGLFAETYACVPNEPLKVDVVVCENTEILFLNAARLLTTCSNSCSHHNSVVHNLLKIFAQKNLALSGRSLHTSPKSIRGRLLSYLSAQAKDKGSNEFTIPFNRQQLADYLSVDRSALSNELGKMQREDLIQYKKNHFQLKTSDL